MELQRFFKEASINSELNCEIILVPERFRDPPINQRMASNIACENFNLIGTL